MHVDAMDVAEYILQKLGEIPCLKLQKLVYYSQAWSLVWEERPIFDNAIEAWANGPVVRDLYARHRQLYSVHTVNGDPSKLQQVDMDTIDAILDFYGDRSSQWLSDLTHDEAPWVDARGDLEPGERGNKAISLASMAEYYSSL